MLPAGDDERLEWARSRLWRLVVPAVMGVTPLISAQFGPYLAFALMLVTHFPTPKSLRESFQQSQAAGP